MKYQKPLKGLKCCVLNVVVGVSSKKEGKEEEGENETGEFWSNNPGRHKVSETYRHIDRQNTKQLTQTDGKTSRSIHNYAVTVTAHPMSNRFL